MGGVRDPTGPHPLLTLAELLLASTFRTEGQEAAVQDRDSLVAMLRIDRGTLGARLRAHARRRLKRVLLFVDQFEELYTLAPEDDRAAFVACLAGAADDPRLRVVLGIGSDFLKRLA
jgi:hypothetical protein